MKKITFLVSLILIVGLSALDTESKPVDTKQDNVVVESNTVTKKTSSNKECENNLPNGTYTEYNTNGTLKSFQVVTDADKNCKKTFKKGVNTEYYEDGRLKSFQLVL